MKIGEKVVHNYRKDVGVGQITAFYPDGCCCAVFPSGRKFDGVPLSCFVSAEKEEFERLRIEKEHKENEIKEKIGLHDLKNLNLSSKRKKLNCFQN